MGVCTYTYEEVEGMHTFRFKYNKKIKLYARGWVGRLSLYRNVSSSCLLTIGTDCGDVINGVVGLR